MGAFDKLVDDTEKKKPEDVSGEEDPGEPESDADYMSSDPGEEDRTGSDSDDGASNSDGEESNSDDGFDSEPDIEVTEFTEEDANSAIEESGLDIGNIPIDQIVKGMNHELEHGSIDPDYNITDDDPVKTLKITLVHLKETPDYYDKLKAMEDESLESDSEDDFGDDFDDGFGEEEEVSSTKEKPARTVERFFKFLKM